MNRILTVFVNQLDAFLRPIPYEKFDYVMSLTPTGQRTLEIRNLKVWLYREGQRWIAQGLDIGYVASGSSWQEAKEKFERGFARTVAVNLEKFGNIDALAKPAPPDIWLAWRHATRKESAKVLKASAKLAEVLADLFLPPAKVYLSYYGSPA